MEVPPTPESKIPMGCKLLIDTKIKTAPGKDAVFNLYLCIG
jgi:hypothetical protein